MLSISQEMVDRGGAVRANRRRAQSLRGRRKPRNPSAPPPGDEMTNPFCPLGHERDLDELHRVEEVLVAAAIAAGEPVHRSPSAPGVRVADKISRAA